LPIEQAGTTRSVSVAELLAGAQPVIEVPSPCVLGRASLGPGGPESLTVGVGLVVANASVAANGTDHASFVVETSFAPTDTVIVNSSGTPKQLPIPDLRALFSAGSNITINSSGAIGATTDPGVTSELQTLTHGLSTTNATVSALSAEIPAGGVAGLNASGQVTAPIAGDASLGTVRAGGVGVARTLETREVDTINVVDFGAVTGGRTAPPPSMPLSPSFPAVAAKFLFPAAITGSRHRWCLPENPWPFAAPARARPGCISRIPASR
jgi:hypothetical protein